MGKFVTLLAFLSCLYSNAFAGPREEVMEVLQKWTQAFSDSDVETILSLYSPDALFLGTGSTSVVDGQPQEIRKYFEKALLNNRPRGAKLNSYSVLILSDYSVVVTGLDTLTGVKDGKPVSSDGRVTFVLEKKNGQWLIVHFHRSLMPVPK